MRKHQIIIMTKRLLFHHETKVFWCLAGVVLLDSLFLNGFLLIRIGSH